MSKPMTQSIWRIAMEAAIASTIAACLAIGHDAFSSVLFIALFVAVRVLAIGVEAMANAVFALGRLQGQLVSMSFGMVGIGAMTASYALLHA